MEQVKLASLSVFLTGNGCPYSYNCLFFAFKQPVFSRKDNWD